MTRKTSTAVRVFRRRTGCGARLVPPLATTTTDHWAGLMTVSDPIYSDILHKLVTCGAIEFNLLPAQYSRQFLAVIESSSLRCELTSSISGP